MFGGTIFDPRELIFSTELNSRELVSSLVIFHKLLPKFCRMFFFVYQYDLLSAPKTLYRLKTNCFSNFYQI